MPFACGLSDDSLSSIPGGHPRVAHVVQKEPVCLTDKIRCDICSPPQQEVTLPLLSSLSEQQAKVPKDVEEEVVKENTETEVESEDYSMDVECGP